MLKFEFVDHLGTLVIAEVTHLKDAAGERYVAILASDPSVRFEGALPQLAMQKLRRHLASDKPPVRAREAGPATVLVIDDNPVSASIAMTICQMCGHGSVAAANGTEAFHWLQARPFDLVLTDLHMPGMDGLAFVRLLRATPGGAELPVIAVTASGPNGVKALVNAGVNEVVRKPYEAKELKAAIDALLG